MNTDASGEEALWGWFELSRATWLTLPRVLLHSMPDEWQGKLAALLQEMDHTFPSVPIEETRVQLLENNKFIKQPDWLGYRHPNVDFINSMRAENGEENLCN